MRSVLAFVLCLLCHATSASAQSIVGRVLDSASGQPVEGVQLELRNQAGASVATTVSDSAGRFNIVGRGPGRYRLELSHIAYATWRSDPIELPFMETVTMDIRIATTVLRGDAITVIARQRSSYHNNSYDGLYARMLNLPQTGSNRVVMKDDPELTSVMTIGDVLNRHFFTVMRKPGVCYFWNGFQVPALYVPERLQDSPDRLEALEVYSDYLMAPMMFRDPKAGLQSTCKGVVAMWARRPDLPGRNRHW